MKLHLADLPEDDALRVTWLEHAMVAEDFGDIVTELAVLAEGRPDLARPLGEIVGPESEAVMHHGLSVLSPSQVRSLFQSPEALLDLQEQVLMDGGPWWQQRLQSTSAHLESAANETSSRGTPARNPWFAVISGLVTLSAAIALVVWLNGMKSTDSNWGWSAPNAFMEAEPPEYMRRLASGAEAWFDKRPETRPALQKRLAELSAGCQRLIDADHEPLSPKDRQWLVDKCRNWKNKFDSALATLAQDASPQTVREEVDTVVNKLIATLRERADTMA